MGGGGTGNGTAGTFDNSSGDASVVDPDGDGVPNRCGGMTYKGTLRGKLDIFVVFDLSGSMFSPAPMPATPAGQMPPPYDPMAAMKTIFEAVSDSIKGFVKDPNSAGIGIALRHFNDECDIDALATPDVAMGDLPGNGAPIEQWLDTQWNMYKPMNYTTSNTMRTNTYPAMKGAIKFQTAWAKAHPDSKAVILLVTDGAPSDQCGSRDIKGVAAEGLVAKLPTYVLGLGNIASLNDVAVAGGTKQAFVVSDPSAAGAAVTEQLNAIRGAAQPLPCQFVIPKGGEDTPELVNLDYKGPGAAAAAHIPQVPDAAACGTQVAWHYDSATKPTTLIACEAACTQFTNGGGTVSLVVGCPTIVIE